MTAFISLLTELPKAKQISHFFKTILFKASKLPMFKEMA